MENKTINLALVGTVANGLQELREKMVFVGGAMVSLYADDPAADEPRPTKDIDMTIDLARMSEWAKMQERLSELGFKPHPADNILCRYRYKEVIVDIMPSNLDAIIPTDKWYQEGFAQTQNYKLKDGTVIRILPVTYFLATKFNAYNDRGSSDARTSKDFEDIVYVTDNCTTLVEDIANADEKVNTFLKGEYRKLWENKYRDEIISGHLPPIMSPGRLPLVIEKIERIIN